jgi:hypothetical protein
MIVGRSAVGILRAVSARRLVRGALLLAASGAAAVALIAASISKAQSKAPTYAHIYWSEPEAARGPSGHGIDNIWQANLDGTSLDRSFVTGLAIPWPVAVGGQFLYWSDSEAGTIGRVEVNGTHLTRTLLHATADALAVTSQYIYWTEGSFTGHPATVWRADLNGSGAQKLFSIGAGTYIGGLAVGRDHIFWTNRDQGTIGRANLNGSQVKLTFITGLTDPTGLALDTTDLYWANGPPGSGNSIGRAGIGGSHVMSDFITGADGPFGVAVGAGHIYWANDGGGTIGRARRDGTHVAQSFIHARVTYQGADAADPFDIAVGP